MMDYYQVLGVSQNASGSEIKSAYRKLVRRFHPDISKDSDADRKIKEINEAYDVLSDPVKKHMYDTRSTRFYFEVEEQKPVHRDPKYRRQSPGRKHKSEQEVLHEWMEGHKNIPRWISIFSLIFCSILALDFSLPYRKSLETIEEIAYHRGGVGIIYTNAGVYQLSLDNVVDFSVGQEIEILTSPIFHVIRALENPMDERSLSLDRGNIYGNFIFGPLTLIICSILERKTKWSIETKFNLAIANVFVFILCLVFLMLS
jgi:hypothetical protein